LNSIFRQGRTGFTLLEVMISILLFSLVLTAIYSIWISLLKGEQVGMESAARVQRSRIAIRALEDAFVTSQMYVANITNYFFYADTSGDMAAVSMVSRLPEGFPGVGRYGDAVVRRVSFAVESSPGGNELVMTQAPMLQDTSQEEPYRLVLARDVTLFLMEFYDEETGEWLEEWASTNQIPRVVKIALGMGRSSNNSGDPLDFATRVVSIPSYAVQGDIQGAVGLPGMGVGGALQPISGVGGLPSGGRPGGNLGGGQGRPPSGADRRGNRFPRNPGTPPRGGGGFPR